MALNNSQYDAIMRDYQRLQSQHRHEQDDRIQEAYGRFPRLSEIHALIASESVACGKALLNGDNQALDRLKLHIQKLGTERASILQKGGYPADYLELTYTCPYCHDTGYIDNQKCQCFKKAEIDLLYTQSNLQGILEEENFSTFSYDYYSDDIREIRMQKPLSSNPATADQPLHSNEYTRLFHMSIERLSYCHVHALTASLDHETALPDKYRA